MAAIPNIKLEATRRSLAYRCYVLALLVVVLGLSSADRQIFSIVLQQIKSELSLSDSQLGLLGGLAFGILYTTVGLPLAWITDRASRRNIITVSMTLWSAMTALCGLANSYGTLFFARMMVGVGEAGGSPPAQALVTDYFPERQRARALGALFFSVPLGYVLSYWFGGWCAEQYGWRATFIAVGVPGVLVALLVRFTIDEPIRVATTESKQGLDRLIHSVKHFLRQQSLIHILAGGTIYSIGTFGTAVWLPAYLMRVHGFSSNQVGAPLGLMQLIIGILGALASGYLTDRLVLERGSTWLAKLPALWITFGIPFAVAAFSTSSGYGAIAYYGVFIFCGQMLLAPLVTSIQHISGSEHRAQGAALYLFLVNLISASIGPWVVGALSDHYLTTYGTRSLFVGLIAVVPITSVWAVIHFFIASRKLKPSSE